VNEYFARRGETVAGSDRIQNDQKQNGYSDKCTISIFSVWQFLHPAVFSGEFSQQPVWESPAGIPPAWALCTAPASLCRN